ncbi:MAG: imidazole glycerol phosphate synthase subunit HisH, partial [Pontimonas sp.]
MGKNVVVFDYGSGNVHSALKALEHAGASVSLTRDKTRALEADGLVVPGVGAFEAVMTALVEAGGDQIIDSRLAGGKAVLGICVGLQVLFETGMEHGVTTAGLGQWPGVVDKLEAPRLPHMGWNTVDVAEGSQLFRGVEDERFYFVHSYGVTQFEL